MSHVNILSRYISAVITHRHLLPCPSPCPSYCSRMCTSNQANAVLVVFEQCTVGARAHACKVEHNMLQESAGAVILPQVSKPPYKLWAFTIILAMPPTLASDIPLTLPACLSGLLSPDRCLSLNRVLRAIPCSKAYTDFCLDRIACHVAR